MAGFPDESTMPRSLDGSEPIRGGSIGFNRVLGHFVAAANHDHQPQFTAVLISAFTVVRNVYQQLDKPSMAALEDGVVRDINLFIEYYDQYLSHVWSPLFGRKRCPVVIYFPDYKAVDKSLWREFSGANAELWTLYGAFMARHAYEDGILRDTEHCHCVLMRAGDHSYPHRDVARKFKALSGQKDTLYTSRDGVCLISHIVLDYYLYGRIQNLRVMESHTARILFPDAFGVKLDKQRRLPFQSAVHATVGDKHLFKPQISPRVKKMVMDAAEQDQWVNRSDEDVRQRLAKVTGVSVAQLRRYDFV